MCQGGRRTDLGSAEGRELRHSIDIIIHPYFCPSLCVCCLVRVLHRITQVNVMNSFRTSKQQEDLLACLQTELKWISAHNPACCVQTCLQTSPENNSAGPVVSRQNELNYYYYYLYWVKNLSKLLQTLEALDHFMSIEPLKGRHFIMKAHISIHESTIL